MHGRINNITDVLSVNLDLIASDFFVLCIDFFSYFCSFLIHSFKGSTVP